MKYKIQTESMNGWADLKIESGEKGHRETELFDTFEKAVSEQEDMTLLLGMSCRVVPEDTPADDDLY